MLTSIITVSAARFVDSVDDLRSLRTVKDIFVRKKKRFNAACILENDFDLDARVEVGYTAF